MSRYVFPGFLGLVGVSHSTPTDIDGLRIFTAAELWGMAEPTLKTTNTSLSYEEFEKAVAPVAEIFRQRYASDIQDAFLTQSPNNLETGTLSIGPGIDGFTMTATSFARKDDKSTSTATSYAHKPDTESTSFLGNPLASMAKGMTAGVTAGLTAGLAAGVASATGDDGNTALLDALKMQEIPKYLQPLNNGTASVYQRVGGGACDPGSAGKGRIVPPIQRPPPPAMLRFIQTATPEQMMMMAAMSGKSGRVAQQTSAMMGMMVISTIGSIVADIVPQSIPPPVWNNRPLPCLPMLLGSNCFGAIKYPITFADFMNAKETDLGLSEYVAEFPRLFADRTNNYPYSYQVYAGCFQAYMSMHCASVFPTCTSPQSSQVFVPILGRMPICFNLCTNVLNKCPGFLFSDILTACSAPSIPPLCAYATYDRWDAIPPPVNEDDDQDNECPEPDSVQDISTDPTLYEPIAAPLIFAEPPEKILKTVTAPNKDLS